MLKYAPVLLACLISTSVLIAQNQPPVNKKPKNIYLPPVVCPQSDEPGHIHIPSLLKDHSIQKKSTLTLSATYNAEFPEAARTSIESIVFPILSNLFESPMPVNISFSWEQLPAGTVAQAQANGFDYSFVNYVPVFGALYPMPLAEKIARAEINGEGVPDIIVQINSMNEYCYDCSTLSELGTQFDFPSILIHEIFHGLGFSALTRTEGSGFIQTIQLDNGDIVTFPYNFYMENGGGIRTLIQPNLSSALTNHLTGGNLFFNLPSRARTKLFAPSTYSPGSSISHLDFQTYANTSSSLMIPSAQPGVIVRDGGLSNDILRDLGWNFTYILHDPVDVLAEDRPNDVDFVVEAEIISETGFDLSRAVLHYSFDGFAEMDSTVAIVSSGGDMYQATIPASGINQVVEYYMEVQDNRGMPFTSPGKFLSGTQATFLYSFGPDALAPSVSHNPVESVKSTDSGLPLIVNASDFFTGVDEVIVEWSLNGTAQADVSLPFNSEEQFEGDRYEGIVPFPRPLTEADVIMYRIIVRDQSSLDNEAVLPESGFYAVSVVPVVAAAASYFNDFDSSTDDFETTDFGIGTVAGFSNGAIHSLHPYPNAGDNNTLDFTIELKIPIILAEGDGAFIIFDEVVLVEPPTPPAVFGDTEFWDYCIVEGKKFGENSWKPFLDGYDSSSDNTWLTLYNNGIAPGTNDSQRSGNSTLFIERRIDLLANGNFTAGDTVFVRFRLFSDPFAVGWGWAIDNLNVQDRTVAVDDFVLEQNFSVQPNPVDQNEVLVSLDLENTADRLIISVYDLYGRQVHRHLVNERSRQVRHRIDISGVPPGMYFVQAAFNDRDVIVRKLVRN